MVVTKSAEADSDLTIKENSPEMEVKVESTAVNKPNINDGMYFFFFNTINNFFLY